MLGSDRDQSGNSHFLKNPVGDYMRKISKVPHFLKMVFSSDALFGRLKVVMCDSLSTWKGNLTEQGELRKYQLGVVFHHLSCHDEAQKPEGET